MEGHHNGDGKNASEGSYNIDEQLEKASDPQIDSRTAELIALCREADALLAFFQRRICGRTAHVLLCIFQ